MEDAKHKRYRLLVFHIAAILTLVFWCWFGCPFYRFLGVCCPGCGLTRAWLSFFIGDWQKALEYHALFGLAPVMVFVFAYRNTSVIKQSSLTDFGLIMAAVLFVVYYFWRM